MSARSSVTRQPSQESDTNNNFASTVFNGQSIQFIVPTMQPGSSYQQSPYPPTAAAVQQLQRMAASNGGNAGIGYPQMRQQQQWSASMPASGSAPFVNPSHMPVLAAPHGGFLMRHEPAGLHNYYTLALGPAQNAAQVGVAATAVSNSSQAYPPNPYQTGPVTSPPPLVAPVAPYGAPFAAYPASLSYSQMAQMYYGQQQQHQGVPTYVASQSGLDYGLGVESAMSMAQQQDVPTSMPVVSGHGGTQQSDQLYQTHQHQKQPARERKMIKIEHPDTHEDITNSLIKEMEEDRNKHPHKSAGDQMLHDHSEGRPSRSTSATPLAAAPAGGVEVSQSDMQQQGVNAFYNAFTEAVAAGTNYDSTVEHTAVSAPSSTANDNQHVQQPTRVSLPAAAAPLEFGTDDSVVISGSKNPQDILGKPEIEFGWLDDSNASAVQESVDVVDAQRDSTERDSSAKPESVDGEDQPVEAVVPDDLQQETVCPDEPAEETVAEIEEEQLDVESKADEEVQPAMTMSFQESNLSEVTVNDTVDTSSVQEVASKLDDGAVETVTTEDENIETQIDKPKSEAANGLPALLANLKLLSDSSEERRYSHEFMELAAKLPTSKIKPQFNTKDWTPENIDDVFNLQKGPAIMPKGSSGSFRSLAPGGGTDFNTPWMKTSPIGPLGRKPYPGRSSDTTGARGGRIRNAGRGSMMKPPPIIVMPLPDVQLNTTENAWKPARKGAPVEAAPEKFGQQAETEKLFKDVRGLLNKITPQMFDELSKEFLSMEPRMNTKERAEGVVEIVFQKAVDEPKFCRIYSNLYLAMARLQAERAGAATKTASTSGNRDTNFRFILVTKCQVEFEKENKIDAVRKEREADIQAAETPEKKQQLQEALNEYLMKEKHQMLGHMRFIGELYLNNMLTAKIMHMCVNTLLRKSADDEESLECLCKLMTTIGKRLEGDKSELTPHIGEYYKTLEPLMQSPRLSSRYRFMIQDLLDLKKNNWQPRRKGDGPKTIEEIHKDAQEEKLKQKLELDMHEQNKQNQHMIGMDNSPSRGSSRRGRRPDLPNRGSSGTPDRHDYDGRGARASMGRDQGRQQPPQLQESLSKFKQPSLSQHLDPSSVKLGPTRTGWAKGAGVSSSTNPTASAPMPRPSYPDQASFKLQNRFNQLPSADEGYSAGSASSSRESSQTRYDEQKRKALDDVRQIVGAPVTMAKPERQDGASPVLNQEPIVDAALDEEKLRRYGSELIDEYLDTGDFNEATRLVEERISSADKIFSHAVNHTLEKTEKHRAMLGQLIGRLCAIDGMSEHVTKGFALFVRNAIDDDLAQDVPKLWAYVGLVLAAALLANEATSSERRLMLNEFREAFREAGDKAGAELLAQTLLAVKEGSSTATSASSSDDKIIEIYRSVSDRLVTDFSFSSDQAVVAAFQKHGLGVLLPVPSDDPRIDSEPPSKSPVGASHSTTGNDSNAAVRVTPPSTPVSLPFVLAPANAHVTTRTQSNLDGEKAELKQLVQADKKLAVDPIINFLQNTRRFEGDVDESGLTLIGALIESMCSTVIVGGDLDDSVNVNDEELDSFCKILLPFVKSRRNVELKTLDTLADIYHSFNCPKGLLVKILSSLQAKEVIGSDGFIEWWRVSEQSLPGMIRSSGEVKMFFSQFTDATSDPGSESD